MNTLQKGDPLPWLAPLCAHTGAPFRIEASGGRFSFFCFPRLQGQTTTADDNALIDAVRTLSVQLDGVARLLFVVLPSGNDTLNAKLRASGDAVRVLLDDDLALHHAFGVSKKRSNSLWFVANPRLKLLYAQALSDDMAGARTMVELARYLPPDMSHYNRQTPPPALLMESVIEPSLCQELIEAHLLGDRYASPAQTEIGGQATHDYDNTRKSRTDSEIPERLRNLVTKRLAARVAPELKRAYQFDMHGIERLVVACYDAATGGRFDPHRDNTLTHTRDRKFAISINLNDEYEGGYIGFPEYTGTLYRPPATGAIAFSCSLMHVVTPITKGRRFALLLFLT
ncbi:2OG-Fe(II) oxygenase [Acetobacter sp. DsW_063]|uniref:2OG-Fe(II) oxygenase n=1 Tax=Acetobacter sp. DsW_063 TaxID=1514894 RepID=UPI000A3B1E6F|nr:2OG-Fe(II) oxygenase [Acetobacter sp. DsW_063]